ncbi:hypothetical protein FACS1894163_09760 [Spirochaetia bacterium]|nr:hypothetical protein FACS1894163_09760 [Spirochaetia bacterium]
MHQETDLSTDVLVIGAGLAGICASIAAARQGCSVILVEKSLVLGGNSGPDAGVHPSGAHRFHTFAAETGIIEEIIETAAWQGAKTISSDMHYNSHMLWDGVLFRTLREAGVQVLRSHYARDCEVKAGLIQSVTVEDTGTYRTRIISVGTAVIESSGDGHIAERAGAQWRQGREGKNRYGERVAPDQDDSITMGSSVVALLLRSDKPAPFTPPPGTPVFCPGYGGYSSFQPEPDETLRFFYPTETGGQINTIDDESAIFDTVLDQLYSAWNYIKNIRWVKESANWELVWIGPRICKRESRRFLGDYVLNLNDVEAGRIFDDAVAYGGFAEDIHYPLEKNPEYVKVTYHGIAPVYTIPYRSIYSKDVKNLFFASRLLSVSHLAHGSVRVQRTLSAIGQAAGTAAALCKQYQCRPRDVYENHIKELQQRLLKEDSTIPGLVNSDSSDLAPLAAVTADEERRFIPDRRDHWLTLTVPSGLMLWDWPKRLNTSSFLLKNNGKETTVKAVLRFRYWAQGWKTHKRPIGFPYEERINEVEWADDNGVEIFEEVARAEAIIPNGEHWVPFRWETDLAAKLDTCDESRYIIELEMNPNLSMAVDSRFFAPARMVKRRGGSYEASAQCPVMVIDPQIPYGEAKNLTDGISRRFSYNPIHMWQTWTPAPHCATLEWERPQKIGMIQLVFDTLMRTYHEMPFECGKRVNEKCVKDYRILAMVNGTWTLLADVRDNYHRFRRHVFEPVRACKIMLAVDASWGKDQPSAVYEIRVYQDGNNGNV